MTRQATGRFRLPAVWPERQERACNWNLRTIGGNRPGHRDPRKPLKRAKRRKGNLPEMEEGVCRGALFSTIINGTAPKSEVRRVSNMRVPLHPCIRGSGPRWEHPWKHFVFERLPEQFPEFHSRDEMNGLKPRGRVFPRCGSFGRA